MTSKSRLDLEEGWCHQINKELHDNTPSNYSKANWLLKNLTPEQKAKLNKSISQRDDIIKL